MPLQSPSPDELDKYFPVLAKPPKSNTFEFGLVLSGTTSAGAYTAGFIDFLIEALDAWEEAKRNSTPNTPNHNVSIPIVAGTSGGGVNAAILAKVLRSKFPHVHLNTPLAEAAENPFYDVWVNRLCLEQFRSGSDIEHGQLVSLLNSQPLRDTAKTILGKVWDVNKSRPAFFDPFRIILTLTNSVGVPYTLTFDNTPPGAQATQYWVPKRTIFDESDHLRFAVHNGAASRDDWRPDEFNLNLGPWQSPYDDWQRLQDGAIASAALAPVLAPQLIRRPVGHYLYRVALVPSEQPASIGGKTAIVVTPKWRKLDAEALEKAGVTAPDQDYVFAAYDGGTVWHEPTELVRTHLAGLVGRNPRGSAAANRAVVVVTPLPSDHELTGLHAPATLDQILLDLVSTFRKEALSDTADLTLFADPTVFSRFLVIPRRPDRPVDKPQIVGSGLGTFLAFMSRDFRDHDFHLGRMNCQKFLKEDFILDPSNPVFGAWANNIDMRTLWSTQAGMLPIIPLMGELQPDLGLRRWPKGAYNKDEIRKYVSDRVDVVYDGLQKLTTGFLLGVIEALAEPLAERKITNLVMDRIEKALREYDLT
jgi:hypothetical protein